MSVSSIHLHVSSAPEKYPGRPVDKPQSAYVPRLNRSSAKQHAQRVAGKLGVSDGLIYLLGQYALNIEDRWENLHDMSRVRLIDVLSAINRRHGGSVAISTIALELTCPIAV